MQGTQRVRQVSRILSVVSTLGIVAVPLTAGGLWLLIGADMLKAVVPGVSDPSALPPLTPLSRALGFIGTMLPGVAVIVGLAYLRRLFTAYAAGHIFTVRNANRICGFAWSVIAMGLLGPVSGAVASVAVTLGNPPGERALAIAIGSPEINTLFVGGVMLVIGWVLREAARMAEENASFV